MKDELISVIREATIDDAETIAIIHIRSWQEMYKEFIPESVLHNLSIAERTQQWHDLIQQSVKVLVIEVGNKIVGFTSICGFRDATSAGLHGEISTMYLHPKFWRKGLGSKLCKAALAELSNLNYQDVHLWVLSDNTQARNFYESLNFKSTDSTKMEEFYVGGALLEEMLYKKILN
jgi:RimJ/RimL family protein N-acetyltransferase